MDKKICPFMLTRENIYCLEEKCGLWSVSGYEDCCAFVRIADQTKRIADEMETAAGALKGLDDNGIEIYDQT